MTGVFTRLATGSDAGGRLHQLNSPWGVVMAPSTFGEHANELLIGNLARARSRPSIRVMASFAVF